MWSFREKRALKGMVKQLLHDARHARNMREDIAEPEALAALDAAEARLREAWAARSEQDLESAAETLVTATRDVYPTRPRPKLRENLEILVVALTVAMGFRTYFVQPFKIPTGSMQPTLNGITVQKQTAPRLLDRPLLNVIPFVLFGERYVETKAAASGQIVQVGETEDHRIYEIRGTTSRARQRIRTGLPVYFNMGDFVSKGQVLASGRVRRGDHIFVDKVRYNFGRPKRGNIFVFATDGIDYDRIRKHTFYIKRLVGLPGERISVDPPYLVADGKRVTEPYPFVRQTTDPDYDGYTLVDAYGADTLLRKKDDFIQLTDDQYLPFGDNTLHSMDGRFFGGVPEENIVGPAFMVYWPFGKRWGRAR